MNQKPSRPDRANEGSSANEERSAIDDLRFHEQLIGVHHDDDPDERGAEAAAFAQDLGEDDKFGVDGVDEDGEEPLFELDLSSSGLRTVPTELIVEHRSTLKMIELYSNLLTDLPAELGAVYGLNSLDISHNRLDRIPEVVGKLPSLHALNVGRNRLSEIASYVFNLANLTILECNSNAITHVSPQIKRLAKLQELDLASNSLTDLPDELTEIRSLILLRLAHNKIRRLPAAIGNLHSLSHLDLADNRIRSLPPGVQWLQNLDELDLSDNELAILPTQLGQLRNLRILNLANNNISKVPPTLGKLTELEELNLEGNSIETLPKELGSLPDYTNINLDDNPLAEPLPSIVSRGTGSLLTYLRSLGDGTPQYESKVLLVGEGGVGKSSLVAALRGDQFVHDRPTTHGIELGQLELEHPQLPVKLQLNTWDFGGQEVYRITHQFFFSRRALYLLVWKPREGHEENNVESWCRRIRLRVGDHARIIVVATHADERRPEFDYSYLRAKFPKLVVGYCIVDSESGRGIEDLKIEMAKEVSRLPQMGEMLSLSWANARTAILSNAVPQISRLTFERICAEYGLDEESAETLSALLHDLGHIIHYADDDGLRDIVVLQPEWLTKAIGYVLEDEETRRRGGVLRHPRLREIWSGPDREHYDSSLYPYFLRLMEKFDVSYRLNPEDSSLVAQLVPYERPTAVWQDSAAAGPALRTLKVVCRMAEEAPGLIAWLTVRNHRFSVGQHWRRGVVLKHRAYGSQAVFELDPGGRDLRLSVIGPSPDYLFHVLRDGLEDLIQGRWRGLAYEFLIPCPSVDELTGPCTGHIPLNVLIRFRQRGESFVPCHSCAKWIDVNRVLTGFGRIAGPLDQILDDIKRSQERIGSRIASMQIAQAETARNVRVVLKMLSMEVSDCPRLFTLVPERRGPVEMMSLHQDLSLTLWCEEPGSEHVNHAARYRFQPQKEWVSAIAPYARSIARLLRFVVPVGAAVYGAILTETGLRESKAELDLMRTLADKLPDNSDPSDAVPSRGMSKAEGSGLRAFRTLLMKLDPSAVYGGMRRVVSASGDYLWVCAEHYRLYDPGLPHV